VDENGRGGFIFPDDDLNQPIEHPPQFISNEVVDSYPKIGLKPALYGTHNNFRPSHGSLHPNASVD
jgi:hypothetical protein